MNNTLTNPFISVLVTSYNREKYIADCLQSILKSTYTNIEILVVDDASTDNTVTIARQFEQEYKYIKVIVNDKNLGQFANRNKAARLAKYDYIKFFDSDDIMYSHCLEVFARAIEKYPESGLFAEYQAKKCSTLLPCFFSPYNAYINHYWRGSSLLYIGPSGTLFNKKRFFEVNGMEENYGILADTLLNLKLAAISPVIGVSRDIFFWRLHSEQVTEGQKDFARIIKERYIIDITALNNIDCPLKEKELRVTIAAVEKRFGRNVIGIAFKQGKLKFLADLLRSCDYGFSDFIGSIQPNFTRL